MAITETKTLQLEFADAGGESVTYSFKDPKAGLDKAKVDAAAQAIIDQHVFATEYGDLQVLKESKIITRTVETIEA